MAGSRDIITRHIEAFNAHDQDAEPWAADAQMVAPGASVSGRDEVLGFLSVLQEAFPSGRLEVKQLLAEGPAAAVEGSFAGTHEVYCTPPTVMLSRPASPWSFGGQRCMRSTAKS